MLITQFTTQKLLKPISNTNVYQECEDNDEVQVNKKFYEADSLQVNMIPVYTKKENPAQSK